MGTLADLREVRAHVAAIADRFDPELVSADDAEAVLAEATALANSARSLQRAAAIRAADVGAQRDGDRDRDSWIGRKTGTSKAKAKAERQTEERLRSQPDVADAARRGQLSPEQTEAIAAAVEANPAAAPRLIDAAERLSLTELRERCRKERARADDDPDATYRRLRRARKLAMWGDVEGAFHLLGQTTGDDGTVISAALGQLTEEITAEAIAEGRFESHEAHAVDALVALCQRYLDAGEQVHGADAGAQQGHAPQTDGEAQTEGGGRSRRARKRLRRKARAARYLGIVRIDLAQLVPDSATHAGPVVEIAGVGRVPLDVARRLLGDAVLKLVITKGTDVLHVAHLGRGPNAAQEVALLWSQPACRVSSCPVAVQEWDHRDPWSAVRVTELGNLDGYCGHHHDLKTYEGWALIDDGPWKVLVSPDDPRHPRLRSGGGSAEPNAPP